MKTMFHVLLGLLGMVFLVACGDSDDNEGDTGAQDTSDDAGVDAADEDDTGDTEDSETEAWGPIFPEDVTAPRILIVGDSISAGPGCYKKYLLQNLTDNDYADFEFVGPYTDDCGSTVLHGAVSCSTATNYTEESFTMTNCFQGQYFDGMSPLVAEYEPDLIMLQLGVNDVWGGDTAVVQDVLDAYSTLVEQAREQNPNVVFVVAQINKVITDGSDCTGDVNPAAEALVEAVPAWAGSETTEASRVLVADLWTNSSPENSADCVHPNDTGAEIMGEDWYNALKDILPK